MNLTKKELTKKYKNKEISFEEFKKGIFKLDMKNKIVEK